GDPDVDGDAVRCDGLRHLVVRGRGEGADDGLAARVEGGDVGGGVVDGGRGEVRGRGVEERDEHVVPVGGLGGGGGRGGAGDLREAGGAVRAEARDAEGDGGAESRVFCEGRA